MKTVKVKNVEIGTGIPKICVPLVEKSALMLADRAAQVGRQGGDMAEWRADYFQDISDMDLLLETAGKIREKLQEVPLLFTFRTAKEGGERQLETEEYIRMNELMIKSGLIDLVDVELFSGEETVKSLIETSHANGVKVVVSNHDFEKTPLRGEIVSRLRKMQSMGADISKIAVMPQCRKDVLTLLAATDEMYTEYADRPIITMSMGEYGVISRVSGETFGSAVTFGALGKCSAPGQMTVTDLRTTLEALHR